MRFWKGSLTWDDLQEFTRDDFDMWLKNTNRIIESEKPQPKGK